MYGQAIGSQALGGGGPRALATEIGAPRPKTTAAATGLNAEGERAGAVPTRGQESRATRP